MNFVTDLLLNFNSYDLVLVETDFKDGKEMWPIFTFKKGVLRERRIHGKVLSELMPELFKSIVRSL